MAKFDNSFSRLPDRFFTKQNPEAAPSPEMVLFNPELAQQLGLDDWDLSHFSGTKLADGTEPIAQAYAGHQFGHFNPRLGDGRAVLLGEILTEHDRFDIQLKGAGRTPFSRNGDGRAWLGPVLREFIISEFMAAANVPTTRALAAVTTGRRVQREYAYPGAVLTRVAASHIRVGTFEYLASRDDLDGIKILADHIRNRHFPNASNTLEIFEEICNNQAKLIAKWMGLGFVHGVMNTDNMAVSGETIDYGPCAFIDQFSHNACYSSIDQNRRYAYANQPHIAVWNLSMLASALFGVIAEETGNEKAAEIALNRLLSGFEARYAQAHLEVFSAKLGLDPTTNETRQLIGDFLELLEQGQLDFTNSFLALCEDYSELSSQFDPLKPWLEKWQDQQPDFAKMRATNPKIIPRTHRIEQAIQAALQGDNGPAQQLYQALKSPFNVAEKDVDLRNAPKEAEIVPKTFCGT